MPDRQTARPQFAFGSYARAAPIAAIYPKDYNGKRILTRASTQLRSSYNYDIILPLVTIARDSSVVQDWMCNLQSEMQIYVERMMLIMNCQKEKAMKSKSITKAKY